MQRSSWRSGEPIPYIDSPLETTSAGRAPCGAGSLCAGALVLVLSLEPISSETGGKGRCLEDGDRMVCWALQRGECVR